MMADRKKPNDAPIYPDAPGFKGEAETSREAAEAFAPKLGRLQSMVRDLAARRCAAGLTPEEGSDLTGIPYSSLQPRFSELKRKGILVDSGLRRISPTSRKRVVVWVLAEYSPKPAEGAEAVPHD